MLLQPRPGDQAHLQYVHTYCTVHTLYTRGYTLNRVTISRSEAPRTEQVDMTDDSWVESLTLCLHTLRGEDPNCVFGEYVRMCEFVRDQQPCLTLSEWVSRTVLYSTVLRTSYARKVRCRPAPNLCTYCPAIQNLRHAFPLGRTWTLR